MDPAQRFTAVDCLAHEYFDGLRDPEVEELIRQSRPEPIANPNRRDGSKSRSSIRGGDRKQSAKHKTSYANKFTSKGAESKQSTGQESTGNKKAPVGNVGSRMNTGKGSSTQKKSGFTSNSINEGKIQSQFAPSSGLGAFLIGKGSSGSLATFNEENAYKYNLEKANEPPQTTQKSQS